MEEPAGDFEPALHTAGEVFDKIMLPALKLHDIEHLVDPFLGELVVKVVEVGMELQVLVGRQTCIKRRILKDEADGGPDLIGVFCAVKTSDLRAAACR